MQGQDDMVSLLLENSADINWPAVELCNCRYLPGGLFEQAQQNLDDYERAPANNLTDPEVFDNLLPSAC